MQRNSGISNTEWRWVIIFSGLLVALTALPYAWAFGNDYTRSGVQFMGMLVNPLDGASYLSKIREGMGGQWLYTFQFTTEPNQGAAIHEFYLFLGHIARVMGFSPLQIFHIVRLLTGFLMFLSFYYLGAVIWPRLRPRRLFFSILSVGSGLGWLALVVLGSTISGGTTLPSDLTMPETIPFFAAFSNPHFPLAIALIVLIVSIFVNVFRPGFTQQPTASNGGLLLILLVVALAVVQPQGLVGILSALGAYLVILTIRMRRIPLMETMWVFIAALTAMPFVVYYLAAVRQDPAMTAWNIQNVTDSPPVWMYLIGFGLVLLIAIPGIWRGITRFERDGDRFMIVWLVVNAIILYLPFNLQRRAAIGLIIPIVYFTVRALEDYWFHRFHPPLREAMLVAVFVFIVPSNLLSMMIPIAGVTDPKLGIEGKVMLDTDHTAAITWLRENARKNDIVLAQPNVSLWIPANSDLRVIYAHPYETLNAKQKESDVKAWFSGQKCAEVLSTYNVNYVVSDQIEGGTAPTDGCYAQLGTPVANFGKVFVYKVP